MRTSRKSKCHVRDGWAAASRALATTGADAPVWPEFPNDDDFISAWRWRQSSRRVRPSQKSDVNRYSVYLLECADGHYYVGVTSKLETRVAEHQAGVDPWCYTFGRRPVRLVFNAAFGTPGEAIFAEKRLKGWSRAKKDALVRGDWNAIRELARSRSVALAHPSTSSG